MPLIKHLAFAGRLRRTDLQSTVGVIRREQARYFAQGKWIYRPREANIVVDYLAGEASRVARQEAANHKSKNKTDIIVWDAPKKDPRSSTSLIGVHEGGVKGYGAK